MRDLILELVPHAPEHGLYVHPDLPADRVGNAVRDYAPDVEPEDVVALYDATLLRSAKDGALFTADRLVFQNHDLESPQTVLYGDIVGVRTDKSLFGGRKVFIEVNRGRATIDLALDFSGRPGAAGPVARFLEEAMLRVSPEERSREADDADARSRKTDVAAVANTLQRLVEDGRLSATDLERMLAVLGRDIP